MLIEAKKSHSPLSASWKTRKASGIIQSQSKNLRKRGGAWGRDNGIIHRLRQKAYEPGGYCVGAEV